MEDLLSRKEKELEVHLNNLNKGQNVVKNIHTKTSEEKKYVQTTFFKPVIKTEKSLDNNMKNALTNNIKNKILNNMKTIINDS